MIDLKPYDELDPAYQASSARVFFHKHYDAMDKIRKFLGPGPDSLLPEWNLAKRERLIEIGLEVWEVSGEAH